MKNFVQKGKVLDYTNETGSTIVAGSVVVVGALVGIAVADILDTETGSVELHGVFKDLPKAAVALVQGEAVYWTGSAVTNVETSNTFMGYAFEAAASGDPACQVLLSH